MHTAGLTMYSSGAFSHGKEAYAIIQSVPLALLGPLADFSQNLREQLISRGSHPCTEHPSPGPASRSAGFALRHYRIHMEKTLHPTYTNWGGSLCLSGHHRIKL